MQRKLLQKKGFFKNSSVFWDRWQCSPLKANVLFGGTCRLYLQRQRINQARNQREADGSQSWFLTWLIPRH
jgi:hypothetical protein